MKMTREEWEALKDDLAAIYEGRLRVLRVGAYEDDGITLMPLEEGSGMSVPKLSVELAVYEVKGDEGVHEYESVSVTVSDAGRGAFNNLPLTDMSAVYARMSVEMCVSCLFGIDDEEEKVLAARAELA